MVAMEVEIKFLRLFKPAALGDRIDGWRVCWWPVGTSPHSLRGEGREAMMHTPKAGSCQQALKCKP